MNLPGLDRLPAVALLLAAAALARGEENPSYRRTSDVIYGRKAGLALTLDVFQPTAKANGAAIVFIVSSGFSSSPEQIAPPFAEEVLKRGYTVFAVIHGSQPTFTIPEIADDVHRAVRFVRYHAKDYGIDPDRIGAGGASSGGLMAQLLGNAGGPGDPEAKDPVDRESSRVQAVAAFFPPSDYLNYGGPGKEPQDITSHPASFRAAYDFREFDKEQGVFVRVTDKDKLRAIFKKISPIYVVSKESAPTLLVHGDKDELVPLQQSELMAAKLKEAGVPVKLVVKKGAGHGWLTILADMPTAADWFDEHLKKDGGK
jgi:acetyl esterase/lipase